MKTKWRLTGIILALALCLSLMPIPGWAADVAGSVDTWDGTVAAAFDGGTGTEDDPYQIATGAQLAYLASVVNNGDACEDQYFELTADIDLNNQQWTPIGNTFANALLVDEDYRVFAGTFAGDGHTISNLAIGTADQPLEADVFGLFGAADGQIDNLYLDTVTIYGTVPLTYGYVVGQAGALAGYAGGPIKNCHATNLSLTITTSGSWALAYWIGGLLGTLNGDSSIYGCSVSGSITEKSGRGSIGGFIGELGTSSKIEFSRADVSLEVTYDPRVGANVGGFIGKGNGDTMEDTVISGCYATGNVSGGSYAGGFAGSIAGLNIKNCYATGNVVNPGSAMGSFAATDGAGSANYGSITNCYTTGTLTGKPAYSYAFSYQDAMKRSSVTNCYFSDVNIGFKSNYETTTEKSLTEMQQQEFVTDLNAGNTDNTWTFHSGTTPYCGAEPADYSNVDTVLAKVPTDLTLYTDASVEALTAATAKVMRGYPIIDQSKVDAMADAIEAALSTLEYKPADYTAVDAAIAKAGALDKSNYKDFSAVTAAIDAVDRTKNITQQDEVDAMAKAITDAISALTEKDPKPTPDPEPTPDPTPTPEVKSFKDVSKDAYYYDAVQWAAQKDITNGVAEDLFDPDGTCTRAQLATMLWREAGKPEPTSLASFTDVPETAYYAKAVAWAVERGITLGTGGGKFSPDLPCTRAQALTMQWRGAGKPEAAKSSSFTDVPQDAYYAGAVAWAVEQGVTLGTGDKTFSPDLPCTRAQAVTFLYRAAK